MCASLSLLPQARIKRKATSEESFRKDKSKGTISVSITLYSARAFNTVLSLFSLSVRIAFFKSFKQAIIY